MIPRTEIESTAAIPPAATFWVPKPSEITDEGFGFFRNVWPLVDAPSSWTRRVLEAESALVHYLDAHSSSVEEFYELATRAEEWLSDDDVEEHLPGAFPPKETEPWPGLHGLDIGVAGLAVALSNSKFFPAASSRGGDGWADFPVVFFAADRPRVELLAGLAAEASCGFGLDPHRPDLLVIEAPSVAETTALARLVFDNRGSFRSIPKTTRRVVRSSSRTSQPEPLF